MLATSAAQGSDLKSLGSYEQQAVEEVLAARALAIDPTPLGKRIARIHVANLDVFSANTGWLRALNNLHRTTLEPTIRRELLVQVGQPWNEQVIAESERILRNPTFTSFVVLVPVVSAQEAEVDLLVVTRDLWSLRTNSEFVNQEGQFTSLKVAAAENNLLGRRKHVSLILEMDQGEYSLSTRWRDLNVLGKRWEFVFRPRLLFSRETDKLEGTQSYTRVVYPLWSLASKWGVYIEGTHRNAIARSFQGQSLATYDDPGTPEVEEIAQEFRLKQFALTSRITRSYGRRFKHIVGAGHELLSKRPEALLRPELSPETTAAFARDLFPRSEVSSAATVEYKFFEPRFVTYRNVNTYDLPEILQAGPNLSADIALALQRLGSTTNFVRHRLSAHYLFDFDARSLIRIGASLARRLERNSNGNINDLDASYGVNWFAATPQLPGALRLVSYGDVRLRSEDQENDIVQVGGLDLRGFEVGAFGGTSYLRSSVEIRSAPVRFGFMRVGSLAFWDMGHAANSPGDLQPRHNIGVGLKALIPQTGESLSFLYWALPLGSEFRLPGRISLGFEEPFE